MQRAGYSLSPLSIESLAPPVAEAPPTSPLNERRPSQSTDMEIPETPSESWPQFSGPSSIPETLLPPEPLAAEDVASASAGAFLSADAGSLALCPPVAVGVVVAASAPKVLVPASLPEGTEQSPPPAPAPVAVAAAFSRVASPSSLPLTPRAASPSCVLAAESSHVASPSPLPMLATPHLV